MYVHTNVLMWSTFIYCIIRYFIMAITMKYNVIDVMNELILMFSIFDDDFLFIT